MHLVPGRIITQMAFKSNPKADTSSAGLDLSFVPAWLLVYGSALESAQVRLAFSLVFLDDKVFSYFTGIMHIQQYD